MFSKSVSLGRWLGIEIRLDYSWFIIFLLVTWSLTTGVFPDTYPNLGLRLNLILGVITSVLFFLSALIHELTHSLVARSQGLEVKKITLFLFGGAAQLSEEPQRPGVEFKTAVVGPLASFSLALIFWSLRIWSRQLNLGLPPTAVFSTLASVNLILAIFNLLPGFPLDGGRILRAGLWKLSGSLPKATRWAASGGRLVAWLLIFSGASRLFVANFSEGLWMMFLGFFLDQAAGASEKESLLRAALANVSVRSAMWSNPPTVSANTNIDELINNYLLPSRHRCLPVTNDEGKPLGLIGIENLKKEGRSDQKDFRVIDLMAPLHEITSLSPDQDLISAAHHLSIAKTSALPVIKDNQLVGLLAEEDLGIYLALTSLKKPKNEI